jgi:hypothetical protein
MSAPVGGSVWYCELCQVEVWVAHVPKRLRHTLCRKWMVRRWPPKKG